ncbi:hypothetical protein GCM10027062_07330 [Nocardioides hungaricus]
MSSPHHDDPELRALLDSIGIRADDRTPPDLTAEEYERAERMLAGVLGRGHHPEGRITAPIAPRRWWQGRHRGLSLTVATGICLILGVLAVATQPWAGAPPAGAQTPAMLRFAGIEAGRIEPAGEPAGALLHQIAARAAVLPEPAELPVQYVELDGWWASSAPAQDGRRARTVLVPTLSRAYLLPGGDRRSIEVRGDPLDSEGRPSTVEPSWDAAPTISDTITALDRDQGLDYLQRLPADPGRLSRFLVPDDVCVETRGGCLLSTVSALFEKYVVPPQIAARLWSVLAAEPTITSLGMTTDRLGREAVALTAPSMSPGQQLLVLADPDSGRYLGSETILVAPDPAWGFDPPAVLSFTALVTAERIAASDVPDDSTATRY